MPQDSADLGDLVSICYTRFGFCTRKDTKASQADIQRLVSPERRTRQLCRIQLEEQKKTREPINRVAILEAIRFQSLCQLALKIPGESAAFTVRNDLIL